MSTRIYAQKMLFKAMIFCWFVAAWQFQCEQYRLLKQYSSEREEVPLVGSIHNIHKQVLFEPTKDTKETNHE